MYGIGTYNWADGRKYEGQWKNANMYGQGTYYWTNGDIYVGEWVDDLMQGYGIFTYSDGTKHDGNFIITKSMDREQKSGLMAQNSKVNGMKAL